VLAGTRICSLSVVVEVARHTAVPVVVQVE
jgi:hypothetical protein